MISLLFKLVISKCARALAKAVERGEARPARLV